MSTPLFLATSLVPSADRTLQMTAVKSWKDAGFTILSVNAAAELPLLTRDYPDVTLIAAPATGERIAGKPVPYIHDLLGALQTAVTSRGLAAADCTVGIINADIHLRLTAETVRTIAAGAQGSIILGSRVDVPSQAALQDFTASGGESYSTGYDYFLMSADLLDDFAASPFCLGMPFWDYWLPIVALLHGRPLKSLFSPVALHIAHETRWDKSIYIFFHALIAYVMELCRESRERGIAAEMRQFDLMHDVLSHVYADVFARGTTPVAGGNDPPQAGVEALASFYDRFQEVVVHHIKSRADPLSLPGVL